MPEAGTGCLFCSIARRDVHSHAVFEDDLIFAFLDASPIRPGHTQIVPKRHYEYFDDLPAHIAARIFGFAQNLAKVMKGTYGVTRVGMLFTGGDIAHAHIIPLHGETDIMSRRYIAEDRLTFRPAPRASREELIKEAEKLVAGLQSIE